MQDTISLSNICQGAVEEVFQRELANVLENVRDPNTSDKTRRKIVLEFSMVPLPDRSGAAVSFQAKTTMAGVNAVGGTIHITSARGKLEAFPYDPRQEVLFAPQKGATQ